MLISNKELKKVLEQIVDEEKEEHNIEFDFHFIGKLTYFKKMEEISKIKMSRLLKIIYPVVYFGIGGFQKQKNKIIVLFNGILVTQRDLIFTLYHEIKHSIDHSKEYLNLFNYDNFIYALDRIYCQLQKGKYLNNKFYHDSLSYEILADKYAIEKTKEFFEKNPQYKINDKWLNKLEKDILDRYEHYDASSRIDTIIKMGISNPNCPFDEWPFRIFIKHDGRFKHIDDICYGLQNWGLEDDRIIKAFLSTKAFRDSFDVNTASEESLKYLVNLFGSKKNKKLKVQSHIKFNDIIDATKVDIPPNIMSLFILIFVSILNAGAIKYDVFFNPEVLKLITFIDVMGLSAITVVIKDLVEILRNKYNINVDQERVDEFISLIQDSYKEDVKSL